MHRQSAGFCMVLLHQSGRSPCVIEVTLQFYDEDWVWGGCACRASLLCTGCGMLAHGRLIVALNWSAADWRMKGVCAPRCLEETLS